MKIAIAGTGYVGLSNGLLLAQHNEVVGLDNINDYYEVNFKYTSLAEIGIERFVNRYKEFYI